MKSLFPPGLSGGAICDALKPGISIVTAVKNRTRPLQFTIPTWLNQPSVQQLVIVDWDSDSALINDLNELDIPAWPDKRCTIVRAQKQPLWNLSQAINLGMRFVRHKTVLKLDADILIIGDVRSRLPQTNRCFIVSVSMHY